LFYIRIAKKYNIVDKPNNRSSHDNVTIRGGGIVYWVAALIYVIVKPSELSACFFGGISVAAAISFWDDIKGSSPKVRLLFHLLAMSCAFYAANLFGVSPWWAIVIGYIVFMGVVNAFNFMDGINGITGLYSIVVLGSMQYVNLQVVSFVDPDLIWFPMLASLVFLFFNFRKNARCFAGDIGSVSIAFWIVFLLLLLMIRTQSLIWIGLLFVYGVDSVCTILHRIYLRQNIFESHRLHFYQILANECHWPHLIVSSLYSAIQLICSALIIYYYSSLGWWIFVIIACVLTLTYCIKFHTTCKVKRLEHS
jgi:UDP-N-acetylmuramyl pentapeptide phosphotransferase/UDP-N-acetylglucosamine-1-phosphate transferase